MSLKFVCTGTFISRLHKEYLLPLLSRWKPYFKKRGVDLDTYDWMEVGSLPITEVLLDSASLPRDLADALQSISEMSTAEAYDVFLQMAANTGWDLGTRPLGGWSREDMAARVLVERPTLFETAMATVQVHQVKNWLDYFDVARGDLSAKLTPAMTRKLEARLRDHWKERKRTPFAEVRSFEVDGSLVLILPHADLSRSQAVIADGTFAREVIHINPETTDMVMYSKETGRLSVSTRFRKDSVDLKALLGEVCWGDRSRYQEFTTYSGRPLIELGSKALQVPAGKFTVRVKACTLMDPFRTTHRCSFQDARPGEELDKHLRDAKSSGCTAVRSLSLAFRFPDRKREVVVTLDDKNKVSVPRHLLQSELVYRFLVDRGFAVPPRARDEAA